MIRRMKEKIVYSIKLFKGDYKNALKRCRELSKEGYKINLTDVIRGFVSWIANEDLGEKDRKELDKLILTIGKQGNLLRRKQYEKGKKESKTSEVV
ncbi:unnamed protein product [marine sediment metagenome]|uniref:Uncharacterized protein n=1 Tax=marine sediment metagenome TaxID=412755 RepID=X1MNK5_9ZZZZ